jgi:hypothetical protein
MENLRFFEDPSLAFRFAGYADDIAEKEGYRRAIDHKGWYTDEFQEDTYRGAVYRLPHGKLLAGYVESMSGGACIDLSETYTDGWSAAKQADRLAEIQAGKERDYQAAWRMGSDYAQAKEERATLRGQALALIRDIKGRTFPVTVCDALKRRIEDIRAEMQGAWSRMEKNARDECWAKYREAWDEGAGI